MPSTSEPAEGIEVSFKLLDASYEHINRKIILQAEELLGIHTDHSFIQKVMECHTEAKTAGRTGGTMRSKQHRYLPSDIPEIV